MNSYRTVPILTIAELEELAQRFVINKQSGCWVWKSTSKRYGSYKGFPAHRVVFTQLKYPVAENMQIDHLCTNKPCVNPSHLEEVTQRENLLRRYQTNPICRNGHDKRDVGITLARSSSQSTEFNPIGEKRYCKQCRTDSIARNTINRRLKKAQQPGGNTDV